MHWNRSMCWWSAGVMCCMALASGCRTTPTTSYETTQDPIVEPRSEETTQDDGREPAPMVGESSEQGSERRGAKIDLGLGSGGEDGGEVHIESSETLLEKQEQAEDLEAARTRCQALLQESCGGEDLTCLAKLDASCPDALAGGDATVEPEID